MYLYYSVDNIGCDVVFGNDGPCDVKKSGVHGSFWVMNNKTTGVVKT